MKKFFALTMILSVLLTATACGNSYTPPAEALSAQEPVVSMSFDEQKELITQNFDIWSMESDCSRWFYTYADLNGNGRLEVISAVLQGTGLYTYANYYEVNSSYSGIEKLQTDAAEGESWPDIIVDSCDMYTDRTNGIYYYIYDDLIRVGAAESHTFKYALCLNEGIIKCMLLSSLDCIYEDGTAVFTYHDADGSVIDEASYNSAADKYFDGLEKSSASFEWIEMCDSVLKEPSLVFASDLFDGYGFLHMQCAETGVYDFASINSDGVVWQVYILDSEFNDAERFIPQVYPVALEGDGSLSIRYGQWIYVYCPCNSWTMATAPEGCAFSWNLNPGKQYSDTGTSDSSSAAESSTAIVITKNPSSESLTVGGNTWFIAHAENATLASWIFTDTDGTVYDISTAMALNPGLSLEALEGDTLAVRNVPQSFNGWSIQAKFEDGASSLMTAPAYIYVSDYINAYASVIEAYKSAFNTKELNENISEFITSAPHIGYALKDLDKNGTPELIIAGNPADEYSNNIAYAIYTLSGGTPTKLCQSSARSRYYILSDLRILHEGSSGAAYSMFELYKVNADRLTFSEGYATYNNIDEPGQAYYHSTSLGSDGYADYSEFDSVFSLDGGTALITALESLEWLPALTQIA